MTISSSHKGFLYSHLTSSSTSRRQFTSHPHLIFHFKTTLLFSTSHHLPPPSRGNTISISKDLDPHRRRCQGWRFSRQGVNWRRLASFSVVWRRRHYASSPPGKQPFPTTPHGVRRVLDSLVLFLSSQSPSSSLLFSSSSSLSRFQVAETLSRHSFHPPAKRKD